MLAVIHDLTFGFVSNGSIFAGVLPVKCFPCKSKHAFTVCHANAVLTHADLGRQSLSCQALASKLDDMHLSNCSTCVGVPGAVGSLFASAGARAHPAKNGQHTFKSITDCCILADAVRSMFGDPGAPANIADMGQHAFSSSREELLHNVKRSPQYRLLCSAGAVESMFGAPGAAATSSHSGLHTFSSSCEKLLQTVLKTLSSPA